MVPNPIPVQTCDATTSESYSVMRLNPSWNLDVHRPIQSLNAHFPSKGRLSETDHSIRMDVITVSLKLVTVFDLYYHKSLRTSNRNPQCYSI